MPESKDYLACEHNREVKGIDNNNDLNLAASEQNNGAQIDAYQGSLINHKDNLHSSDLAQINDLCLKELNTSYEDLVGEALAYQSRIISGDLAEVFNSGLIVEHSSCDEELLYIYQRLSQCQNQRISKRMPLEPLLGSDEALHPMFRRIASLVKVKSARLLQLEALLERNFSALVVSSYLKGQSTALAANRVTKPSHLEQPSEALANNTAVQKPIIDATQSLYSYQGSTGVNSAAKDNAVSNNNDSCALCAQPKADITLGTMASTPSLESQPYSAQQKKAQAQAQAQAQMTEQENKTHAPLGLIGDAIAKLQDKHAQIKNSAIDIDALELDKVINANVLYQDSLGLSEHGAFKGNEESFINFNQSIERPSITTKAFFANMSPAPKSKQVQQAQVDLFKHSAVAPGAMLDDSSNDNSASSITNMPKGPVVSLNGSIPPQVNSSSMGTQNSTMGYSQVESIQGAYGINGEQLSANVSAVPEGANNLAPSPNINASYNPYQSSASLESSFIGAGANTNASAGAGTLMGASASARSSASSSSSSGVGTGVNGAAGGAMSSQDSGSAQNSMAHGVGVASAVSLNNRAVDSSAIKANIQTRQDPDLQRARRLKQPVSAFEVLLKTIEQHTGIDVNAVKVDPFEIYQMRRQEANEVASEIKQRQEAFYRQFMSNMRKDANVNPEYTFDKLRKDELNHDAFSLAFKFLASINQKLNKQMLLVFGDRGSGKTLLCHAIANQYMNLKAAAHYQAPRHRQLPLALIVNFDDVKKTWLFLNKETYEEKLSRENVFKSYCEVDLLILDGLCSDNMALEPFSQKVFSELIRARVAQNLPMVITTSINLQAIHKAVGDLCYEGIKSFDVDATALLGGSRRPNIRFNGAYLP